MKNFNISTKKLVSKAKNINSKVIVPAIIATIYMMYSMYMPVFAADNTGTGTSKTGNI